MPPAALNKARTSHGVASSSSVAICMRYLWSPCRGTVCLQLCGGALCYVQAANSPTLINLLRALSYQKRMLAEAALSAAAQESVQGIVDDLTETLRTVLCL